jgi:uncharacterized protein (TIGR03435 family)
VADRNPALIVLAYGIAGYQIGELPGWTNDERYDIVAKMPPGTFTPPQRASMIRALLADRFKLKTHTEMREIPIYALVYERSDKKLGPALHPTTLDCAAVRAKRAGRGPTTPEELMECNFLTSSLPGGIQRLRAQAVSLTELAAALGGLLTIPSDRTAERSFDLDLTSLPQVSGPRGRPGDIPFIFNAVRELGLKLGQQDPPPRVRHRRHRTSHGKQPAPGTAPFDREAGLRSEMCLTFLREFVQVKRLRQNCPCRSTTETIACATNPPFIPVQCGIVPARARISALKTSSRRRPEGRNSSSRSSTLHRRCLDIRQVPRRIDSFEQSSRNSAPAGSQVRQAAAALVLFRLTSIASNQTQDLRQSFCRRIFALTDENACTFVCG